MVAKIEAAILRRKQVEARIGLSRSAIYAKLKFNADRPKEYDPTFPKPVMLGERSVGWVAAEVDAWLDRQIAKSRTDGASCPAPAPATRAATLSAVA